MPPPGGTVQGRVHLSRQRATSEVAPYMHRATLRPVVLCTTLRRRSGRAIDMSECALQSTTGTCRTCAADRPPVASARACVYLRAFKLVHGQDGSTAPVSPQAIARSCVGRSVAVDSWRRRPLRHVEATSESIPKHARPFRFPSQQMIAVTLASWSGMSAGARKISRICGEARTFTRVRQAAAR